MNDRMMTFAPMVLDVSRAEAGRDGKDNPKCGSSRKDNDMTAARNRQRTTPNPIVRIAILVIALAGTTGAVRRAEPAKAPASAEGIVLPPPKVELPPLPVDGSGVWRLHLEDGYPGEAHCGPTPLWVVLEVDKGKVQRAVALPIHQAFGATSQLAVGAWGRVDASGLSLAQDRITGRMTVAVLPAWFKWVHDKRYLKDKWKPYEMKPEAPSTVVVDVAVNGHEGAGSWSLAEPDKRRPSKGEVVLRREPPLPLPENYDLDLFMPAAFGDSPIRPHHDNDSAGQFWCRVRMGKTGPIKAVGMGHFKSPQVGDLVTWRTTELTWQGQALRGRFQGAPAAKPADTFTLDIEGERIGRNLYGTVTLRQGDYQFVSPWRGLLDTLSPGLPMEDEPGETWEWKHDRQPDPQLTATALEESARAVLPGEPNKTGFWTWRPLAAPGGALGHRVSVIYAPCFDLEETPGAAKYRFQVKPQGYGDKTFTFEADQPWRPLSPIWKEVPPGEWALTVTALDGTGRELPGPMRMGVGKKAAPNPNLEKPEDYVPPTRVVVETKAIPFVKRPCFAGPYNSAPRDWTESARLAASWIHFGGLESGNWYTQRRGLNPTHHGRTGGEGTFMDNAIWSELALRALSQDPGHRMQSEEMLRMWLEAFRLHQQKCSGLFHYYQWHTPPTHFMAEQMLDAWVQTGDPAWKRQLLDYGRALVKLQNKNGTFINRRRHGENLQQEALPGPDRLGYFSYSLSFMRHEIQWGTSELLYTLGRLRRDLKTDEFVEAERLAHRWMIEVGIRERFFPLYINHSMSVHWPQNQHAMSALYFSRYLLELAPEGMRDVKQAEEVARWAEDHNAHWNRSKEDRPESNNMVMPRIPRGDRGQNAPAEVNLLAAIVFEQLGRATGNPLWTAKGEALATAVLVAQHPRTGYIPVELLTRSDAQHMSAAKSLTNPLSIASGQTIQLLREYAALKEAKK
jgi:hypothetical protein